MAFDLPGMGLSDKPKERDYSWPALAASVAEILHHEDLQLFERMPDNNIINKNNNNNNNNKLHLVVHDIGGPIAALYATENLGEVASMTILDTIFDIESFSPPFPMFFFPPPILGEVAMKSLTPLLFQQFQFLSGVQDKSAFSYEEAQAWVWLLKNDGGSDTFLNIMRSFPNNEESKTRLTKQIRVVLGDETQMPMQIVWAKDDVAIPDSQGRYMRDNFNVQRVQTVAGGHFYQLESPAEIVDAIDSYLS